MKYASKGMQWIFNPPCVSHMGGFWERMIHTIRRVRQAVRSHTVRLTDEILEIISCEVESIVMVDL